MDSANVESKMKIENIRTLEDQNDQINELNKYSKTELKDAIIKCLGYVDVMEKEKEIWEFEKERQRVMIQATLEQQNNMNKKYLDENDLLKKSVSILKEENESLKEELEKLNNTK